jgi:DNA-binding transcriptional ArsR family regulator
MVTPAELFKILSVDSRVKIIELLKEKGPLCVNGLSEKLGITRAAVSQHLRILKSVGLVEPQRQGYWIPYSLNENVLEKYREVISKVCSCGCQGIVCPPLVADTKRALKEYKRELEKELKRVERRLKGLEGKET